MSKPEQRYDLRLGIRRLLNILGVLIVLAVVLFPIAWMISASMRPVSETLHDPPLWLPHEITFAAYRNLLSQPKQIGYFVNTYTISLSTAFLSISLGALCAYGFSRFRI